MFSERSETINIKKGLMNVHKTYQEKKIHEHVHIDNVLVLTI